MALQDALNASLRQTELGPVVGAKIGCTTPVMQEYLGMAHPCSGAIFDATVHHRQAELDFGSYLHVGVECEIAVTLGADIPRSTTPHTMDSVACAVRSVHAAIEIVDDRYVDFVHRTPDWRTWVADNFFGAGVVLGEPVVDWQSLDLPAVRGQMEVNGEMVGSGHGRDIIHGHPLEALVWLANEQSARGLALPAGWIVMLGSVVQTKWMSQGDRVEVSLAGLGTASAHFH